MSGRRFRRSAPPGLPERLGTTAPPRWTAGLLGRRAFRTPQVSGDPGRRVARWALPPAPARHRGERGVQLADSLPDAPELHHGAHTSAWILSGAGVGARARRRDTAVGAIRSRAAGCAGGPTSCCCTIPIVAWMVRWRAWSAAAWSPLIASPSVATTRANRSTSPCSAATTVATFVTGLRADASGLYSSASAATVCARASYAPAAWCPAACTAAAAPACRTLPTSAARYASMAVR